MQQEELKAGEEFARCPSCSLYITVIYNVEDFQGADGGAAGDAMPAAQQAVEAS